MYFPSGTKQHSSIYDAPLYITIDDLNSFVASLTRNLLNEYDSGAAQASSLRTGETFVDQHSQKGSDLHRLYKNMLALDPSQKNQLKEKFGLSLTKFAICSLLCLYREGTEISSNKTTMRNIAAFARRASGFFVDDTDRAIKTEFFVALLSSLDQHGDQFLDNFQAEKSRYENQLNTILNGVNVQNALTLFDDRTASVFEANSPNAKISG